MQLFFLHFAGGNCYSYDFLKPYCNAAFELHCLELPGRGKRFSEDLLYDKAAAIADYVAQLKILRNSQPYLLFGHSMGASLGLHVCQQMEAQGDGPESLIVSGNAGPGIVVEEEESDEQEKEEKRGPRYLLETEEFKEALRELGGIPEEVLETAELFDFFAPIIRADFEIVEKEDALNENIKLHTPIFAIMGSEEEDQQHIDNWKRFTRNKFRSRLFSGGHFFIHKHPKALATILNGVLVY